MSGPDSVDKLYLAAAGKGDLQAVEFALQHPDQMNKDAKDGQGRSALHLAIVNGHTRIIQSLLRHGVNVGDSLLRAVDIQFYQAVQAICSYAVKLPEGGHDIINSRATDAEYFHPDITPIILAAHHNNYDIIKLLLHHGAYVEDPREKRGSYVTEKHTLQHSLGMLNIFKALCSEAYISLTSLDPIERAFKLSERLRNLSNREYEFRQDYVQLSEQCEEFAAALLGQTRNTEELTSVLNHHEKLKYKDKLDSSDNLPQKAFQAIAMEQKKFVAHPHCQQLLIEHWYGPLKSWRHKSFIENVILSFLVCLGFPFLCIAYYIAPVGKLGKFMRIPFVKFLMYTASFLTFLVLLFLTTEDIGRKDTEMLRFYEQIYGEKAVNEGATKKLLSQERGRIPYSVEWLIFVWILGMTWREIKEAWRGGFRQFINDPWNLLDFSMIALFWGWISLRVVSYVLIHKEREVLLSTVKRAAADSTAADTANQATDNSESSSTTSDLYTLIEDQHLETRRLTQQFIDNMATMLIQNLTSVIDSQSCTHSVLQLTRIINNVFGLSQDTSSIDSDYVFDSFSFYEDFHPSISSPRKNWNQYDPSLIADLLFSAACVLSMLRLLQVIVISDVIGPMQISVTKMIIDISKFLFIFFLIWMAFAMGMTQVYWSYALDDHLRCKKEQNEDCDQAFGSFGSSMSTLFWSIFGLVELSKLKVKAEHDSVETFGLILYAFYYVIAVVVLLNLLIAVMSDTYSKIEANADSEWKFSRSEMWVVFFEEGSTLPPPFNILPSLKTVFGFFRSLYYLICRKAAKLRTKKQQEKIQMKERMYQDVVGQLCLRYFAEKKSGIGRESEGGGISTVEFMGFKQDMSAFRFELYGMIQKMERSIVSSNQGNIHILEEMAKMEARINSTNIGDSDAFKRVQGQLLQQSDEGAKKIKALEERLEKQKTDATDFGTDTFMKMAEQLQRQESPALDKPLQTVCKKTTSREVEVQATPEDIIRETSRLSHIVDVHSSASEEDDGDQLQVVEEPLSAQSTEAGPIDVKKDARSDTVKIFNLGGNVYFPGRSGENAEKEGISPIYQLFEKLSEDN
ncbi:short transient receptor potential channel 4-like [Glandiceps talaboti]